MKRVLFDSDVLLDVLLRRQPYFTTSALALDTVDLGKVEGLEIIVTRNIKDFGLGRIPAMRSDVFLATLS